MAEVWTMGELLCEIMRPEVGVPLNLPGKFLGPYPSGAPAIFIDTVARLGHTAGIVGGVGRDDFAKCLLDRLANDGVNCSQITEFDTGTTGVAFVTYFNDGSRCFVFHFPDTPATWAKAPAPEKLGDDVKCFHIMGCSLMAERTFGGEILKLMRGLVARGAKISFDPNIRPELMRDGNDAVKEVMTHCNVFLPGRAELLSVSGKNTIEEAAAACFENPCLEVIAMKDGSEGCTIFTRDEKFSMGVYPVDVKDPTGAGDVFDAAFLCGLLEGKPLLSVAKAASAAAALNTAAFGPMEGEISRANISAIIKEDF